MSAATDHGRAAAGAYGIDDEDGPLDDPEHWIWEAAIEAAGEQ
jgi:hypothetical protein